MIPLAPVFHSLLGGGNQFASGGVLLMIVGAIGVSLRKIPSAIWRFINNQITLTATISDEKHEYYYFNRWIQDHFPQKRLRRMALMGHKGFVLSEGTHWFWHKGRPLFITLVKAPVDKAVSNLTGTRPSRPETLTLRTYGRDRQYMETIRAWVTKTQRDEESTGLCLRVVDRDNWSRLCGGINRKLDSVILPEETKETLVKDIQVFLDSKDWYVSAGIPYHRGYLLHGLPGTGKSSLVEGLASHFKRDIYILNLSSVGDKDLPHLFASIHSGSILLMEDIDCLDVAGNRQTEDADRGGRLSLSALLNVLDGLQAPSGALYFMTTNHREKLDPALIRPGRIDVQIEFGYASREQSKRLYQVFFPDDTEVDAKTFAWSQTDKTMAELQMSLMQQRNLRFTAKLEAV